MQDYKKLRVWNEAHDLVLKTHTVVKKLPKYEQFALASQLWHAAYSVPANIVEGAARNTQKEFRNFLHISLASAQELGYFFLLAKDVGYIKADDFAVLENQRDKVCGMLVNLISKIVPDDGKRSTVNGERND